MAIRKKTSKKKAAPKKSKSVVVSDKLSPKATPARTAAPEQAKPTPVVAPVAPPVASPPPQAPTPQPKAETLPAAEPEPVAPPPDETPEQRKARVRAERIERARAAKREEEAKQRAAREAAEQERRNRVLERQRRQQQQQFDQAQTQPISVAEPQPEEPPQLRAIEGGKKDVPSLAEERRKREEASKSQVVQLPFSEVLKWKYDAKNERKRSIARAIVEQVKRIFEPQLNAQIQKALETSPEYVAAAFAVNQVVNEIIDGVEGDLPEGYAVSIVDEKQGIVKATYNPQQVGYRLPVASEKG